jgi:hypothetical protein
VSFDEIPEDKKESFPCECGGNITETSPGIFECDKCEFKRQIKIEVKP